MKVVFFNFYHNGDIHVSRSLVREISNICKNRNIPCEYYHPNNPNILNDINHIKHTNHNYNLNPGFPSSISGNTVYINTWYMGNKNIWDKYKISFDNLYYSFIESAKLLDIDLRDIDYKKLFPIIDFNCFNINKAKNWLSVNTRPRVFISNGKVLSGQSCNFDFSDTIVKLARSFDYIDFVVSNKIGISLSNVFFTSDIIQNGGFDLNENSYIASYCDLIVGRCSGAYSFAITSDNYWDKPKTFLAFTSLETREATWTERPINAKIITHDIYDNRVFDIIKEHLPARQ